MLPHLLKRWMEEKIRTVMMEAGVTQEKKDGGKKKDGNYGSRNDTKFNSHPGSSFPKSRKVIKRDGGDRKAPPPPEKMDGGKN